MNRIFWLLVVSALGCGSVMSDSDWDADADEEDAADAAETETDPDADTTEADIAEEAEEAEAVPDAETTEVEDSAVEHDELPPDDAGADDDTAIIDDAVVVDADADPEVDADADADEDTGIDSEVDDDVDVDTAIEVDAGVDAVDIEEVAEVEAEADAEAEAEADGGGYPADVWDWLCTACIPGAADACGLAGQSCNYTSHICFPAPPCWPGWDLAGAELCYTRRDDGLPWTCADPLPDFDRLWPPGVRCTADSQCASGYCWGGICRYGCAERMFACDDNRDCCAPGTCVGGGCW